MKWKQFEAVFVAIATLLMVFFTGCLIYAVITAWFLT